jgi:hypothetical protein
MRVVVTSTLLFFIVGCSAVPTVSNESLAHFSKSVTALKADTEASFSEISDISEARFKAALIRELAEGDTYSLDKLDIDTDFKTLSVKQVPYFLKLKMLQYEVGRLNTVMVDYVNLLANLADHETISTERFDALASDLNNNVRAAVPSIRSEGGKADTGLFSFTAMALTKSYLQSKQSKLLVGAIRHNQPSINRFAAHLQRSVLIIARAVNFEYLRETSALKVAAVKGNNRAENVDRLIERNKKHFADIQTLKRLHTNYGRLTLMHSEISDVIMSGNRGLPMMFRMLEVTSKLNKDYQKTLVPAAPAGDFEPAMVDPAMVSEEILD